MFKRNRVLTVVSIAGLALTVGTGYAAAAADDDLLTEDHLHWDTGPAVSGWPATLPPDLEGLLTVEEVEQATAVAERAVPGGRVSDIDRSETTGKAYDVQVIDPDGVEWDVELRGDLSVIRILRD